MKFVCAFLIVLTCLIPFLIGAGFGMDALLGYCTSDSGCPHEKVCNDKKCTDLCAHAVCDDHEYCEIENRTAICLCQPGYVYSLITFACERKIECKNNEDCDAVSKCQNGTCFSLCSDKKCGRLENCELDKTSLLPVCNCQPGYRRNPNTMRCAKRCLSDQDCDAVEACQNKLWCNTPCVGPVPPHTLCVPQDHKPSYQCVKCYRPSKTREECVLDTEDPDCRRLVAVIPKNHL